MGRKLLLIVAAVLGVMVQGLEVKDGVSCYHPQVKDQNIVSIFSYKGFPYNNRAEKENP